MKTVQLLGGYVGGAIACAAAVFGKKFGFNLEPEWQLAFFAAGLGMFGVTVRSALYTTPPKEP